MPQFIDTQGHSQQVTLDAAIHAQAQAENVSVPALINRLYASADLREGTAFQQFCVSEGLYLPKDKGLALRPATIGDILNGKTSMSASAVTQQRNSDYGGTQARILFPVAVIDMIENQLPKDLTTDTALFNQMLAITLGVASDTFEQPIIDYQTTNGPDGANRARAQRSSQLAGPGAMAIFTTSQQPRRLPSWNIGAEFSDQALRTTTLDLVALNLGRFLAVERDARVYNYLSLLWAGDNDMGSSAITAVTSSTLNGTATAGVMTHKAWVKWLFRLRKQRRLDYVVCDIDTYLKLEGRTGRVGQHGPLDPALPKIDPQVGTMNVNLGDVKCMIVDAAADGGPVPANTVWGVDSRFGIVKVSNTTANSTAAEEFALKRSRAFRIDWSETVYRQYDAAFDVLTID